MRKEKRIFFCLINKNKGKVGAASGTRTRTAISGQGILSPSCLPFHHRGRSLNKWSRAGALFERGCKGTPISLNCQTFLQFFLHIFGLRCC